MFVFLGLALVLVRRLGCFLAEGVCVFLKALFEGFAIAVWDKSNIFCDLSRFITDRSAKIGIRSNLPNRYTQPASFLPRAVDQTYSKMPITANNSANACLLSIPNWSKRVPIIGNNA